MRYSRSYWTSGPNELAIEFLESASIASLSESVVWLLLGVSEIPYNRLCSLLFDRVVLPAIPLLISYLPCIALECSEFTVFLPAHIVQSSANGLVSALNRCLI